MHHPLRTTAALTLIAAALALAACDRAAPAKPGSDTPTWKQGEAPVASAGLTVSKLATGLMHPRALYPLPNGDILIVEATGPAVPVLRPKDLFTPPAGPAGKGGRITLVRPGVDGAAAQQTILLDHLAAPGGVALVGTDLYVAQADALLRYPYNTGDMRITAPSTKVADLPDGPLNRHWVRSLLASEDGARLYVGVGSASDVGENGMDLEKNRAAILEVDRATGAVRTFASGLRDPNAMQWEPHSLAMWTVVNERNVAVDYLTSVREGGFYGWPYSYNGATPDPRAMPQRLELAARAIAPDYPLAMHPAPLGLAFNNPASTMPPALRDGAFIGQQFRADRSVAGGYKVVFVPFADGKPAGPPVDVVTGFLDKGRPVGLTMDHRGALLIADDVGNTVWRVSGPPLK
jgi:glucose/arabinose dehydrogenase